LQISISYFEFAAELIANRARCAIKWACAARFAAPSLPGALDLSQRVCRNVARANYTRAQAIDTARAMTRARQPKHKAKRRDSRIWRGCLRK
jgi:hypothetical protein